MKEATLKGYRMVCFDKGAVGNILSFIRIREKYPISYDTKSNYFYIMKPDKEVLFRQRPSGLYFNNTSYREVFLIKTILDSREVLSQKQYNSSKKAQYELDMVGYPSEK